MNHHIWFNHNHLPLHHPNKPCSKPEKAKKEKEKQLVQFNHIPNKTTIPQRIL